MDKCQLSKTEIRIARIVAMRVSHLITVSANTDLVGFENTHFIPKYTPMFHSCPYDPYILCVYVRPEGYSPKSLMHTY